MSENWAAPWADPDLAAHRCINCERDIVKVEGYVGDTPPAGLWEDGDGFVLCMKYSGPLPVPPGGYVYHQPLPEVK